GLVGNSRGGVHIRLVSHIVTRPPAQHPWHLAQNTQGRQHTGPSPSLQLIGAPMSHEDLNRRNAPHLNANTGGATMPDVAVQGTPHVQATSIVRQSVSLRVNG